MNPTSLKWILLHSKVMAGKPCIRGLRITVGTIIGLLSVGKTHEEILELYPDLEKQDIFSALEYVTRKVSRDFIK